MNVLLLSGSHKIGSQPVLEVLHELRPFGVHLQLALWGAVTQELADAAEPDLVVWGPKRIAAVEDHQIVGTTDATDFSASTEAEVAERPRPRGLSPDRIRAAYEWRALRLRKALRPYWGPFRARVARVLRKLLGMTPQRRCWRRLRRDERVLQWAREADVIVAMDAHAILAAWKLARRLPEVDAVYGLSAGRGHVVRRLTR